MLYYLGWIFIIIAVVFVIYMIFFNKTDNKKMKMRTAKIPKINNQMKISINKK